jgi:DNA-binding response OmpR family regulator
VKKIVVIDDNVDIANTVKSALEAGVGCEVLVTYSGRDGIRLCDEEKPVLVLLDLRMPEMDGIEVANVLKDQKILFMTAYRDYEDRMRACKNAVGVIHKPFDLDDLILRVKKILGI